MKVTVEIPDESKTMSVTLIFMEDGAWYCINALFDTKLLKDGANYKIPARKREADDEQG